MQPAVAIFAFNRPESLSRLLDSLKSCPEFPDADVTIFIDGPRNADEAVLVARTLAIASSDENWRVVSSPINLGLRKSIVSGVSRVCKRAGHAIVLEDDLVVSPAALQYFIDGLQKYEQNERVWAICGYMFDSKYLVSRRKHFFLPYAHPWGWATWSRAWDSFNIDRAPVESKLFHSRSFRLAFDAFGLYPLANMLKLAQKNLVNSWYVQWHRLVVERGGVCLFSPRSYVENMGVRAGGTHASALNLYSLFGGRKLTLCDSRMEFPQEVEIDFLAIDGLRRSWEVKLHRMTSVLGGWKRRLKSVMANTAMWRNRRG